MEKPEEQIESKSETIIEIASLSTEVIYDILANISFKDLKAMRKCSHRMRDICDGYIMHLFQKSLNIFHNDNEHIQERAVLIALDLSTSIYDHSGFFNTVANCFGHMMHKSNKPFAPDFSGVKKYLLAMYHHIHDIFDKKNSQKHQIMYVLTFIALTKCFKQLSVKLLTEPNSIFNQEIIETKIIGPWLGILWMSDTKVNTSIKYQYQILIIICELAIGAIANQSLKRVWQCHDICYVYGYRNVGDRLPKLKIKFNVSGSKEVCELIRASIVDEEFTIDKFGWPQFWKDDLKFSISLNLTSKEVVKWGCCPAQLIELHPKHLQIDEYQEQTESEESLTSALEVSGYLEPNGNVDGSSNDLTSDN